MKIIPVYLPQFHRTPENDKWWGEGFTEWTNVRAAKQFFDNHYQPRIPLDNNYYDLTDVETLKWQAKLANEYGIYGFCMYHYWFNGRILLHKPMELLLQHPEIDLKYCISWANHDWTDGWKASDGGANILIAHDFDKEEDWVAHFNYLLQFFKDPRYMRENDKPIMVVYAPHLIRKCTKMLTLWNKMAIEAGFPGLTFIYQSAASAHDESWERSMFDYGVEFQPGFVSHNKKSLTFFPRLMKYSRVIKKMLGIKTQLIKGKKGVAIADYDQTWQKIIAARPSRDNMIPSAFVDWDNTPRHMDRGYVYREATPEKFKSYFAQLVYNTREYYKQDKIFVFAWNEWAEGGYLEPDKKHGYGYLEAIRDVVNDNGQGTNADK